MMSEDAGDLTAAVAGDQDALARLFRRHAGVVLALCRRGGSLAEAEDAMQETFLRAYRKLSQLRNPGHFAPWLYAIARRVCSEKRRSAQRRKRHEAVVAGPVEPAEEPLHVAQLEQDEQLARLSVALDGLGERERLAIHLYYLEPDPAQSAYAAMGLSRSGFHKLLARARHVLEVQMREAKAL